MDDLLRQVLLDGQTILVAVGEGSLGAATAEACSRLGANLVTDPEGQARLDAVLIEPSLGDGEDDDAALVTALGAAWDVVHGAANAILIEQQRGKIVLLAPRPDGGVHAEALRDGLENMARTLSIEWARYGILPTMVAPGPQTTDDEAATLVAYLVSPAGDYYSGCRFELGSV
jgi:NAD(P)-dependent dehydrogenase (short-subunit alcohol dehydrogenase family)